MSYLHTLVKRWGATLSLRDFLFAPLQATGSSVGYLRLEERVFFSANPMAELAQLVPEAPSDVVCASAWLPDDMETFRDDSVDNIEMIARQLIGDGSWQQNLATLGEDGSKKLADSEYDAATVGTDSGDVTFEANDPDEDLFNSVTETGAAPPTLQVIDNGDSGYRTTGTWSTSTNGGLDGDHQWTASGSGADIASWTFDVTPGGEYQVAATWLPAINRATDAPYTVIDGDTALETVTVNQELTPGDLNDKGAGWEILGTYIVTGDTLTVELSDVANQYVIADAVRIERLDDIGPEIQVQVEGANIVDDEGSFDYGTTGEGSPITKAFIVKNIGTQSLTLAETVKVPDGFSLVASFGTTTVAPNATTSFSVQYDAATVGTESGDVTFEANDPDEDLFNSVTETGAAPPTLQVIDNGDSGYRTTGTWSTSTNGGLDGDHQWTASGSGADIASWTFDVTPGGEYQVAATWLPAINRATDAPYTVIDGDTALETVTVNQELTPGDLNDKGAGWEILGTYIVTGDTLTVELSDVANQYVIADAVRIERLDDIGPEIQVQVEGANIVDDEGSFDYGTTGEGSPITKAFIVKNIGTQSLTLAETVKVPDGFSLVASFGTTTVAPNATTSFSVQYDAATVGTESGEITFETNDPDEGTFNFLVTGTRAAPPTLQVIDNGDSGYRTTGTWSTSTNGGLDGDHQWTASGSGADIASWTFDVTPGEYQVAATWLPAINRATDAPYTVIDGDTALQTVTVDQELTPNDLSDQGVGWEILGTYTVSSDRLTVELSDVANQYVIADAVRIERLDTELCGTVTVQSDKLEPLGHTIAACKLEQIGNNWIRPHKIAAPQIFVTHEPFPHWSEHDGFHRNPIWSSVLRTTALDPQWPAEHEVDRACEVPNHSISERLGVDAKAEPSRARRWR